MTGILFMLSALLVACDQFSKFLAVKYLAGQSAFVIWDGVLELRYCENTGVAFSMLENQRWIFIPLTLVVMLLVAVILLRSELCRYKLFGLSAALILAGGAGNLIDRIVMGYVTDFIYVKIIDFPIFNFADCCVTVGAVLLFVFFLFVYREKEEKPLRTLLFGIPTHAKKAEGSDHAAGDDEKLDNDG